MPQEAADLADAFALHPAMIDAVFHPLFALVGASGNDDAAYVPVQIGRIDFMRRAAVGEVLAREVKIEGRGLHTGAARVGAH